MLKDLARDVDRLLRGKFTKTEDLRAGRIEVPVKTLVIVGHCGRQRRPQYTA